MAQYAYPSSDIDNSGAWTYSAGSTLEGVLDEGASYSDADYVTSPKSASNKSFTVAVDSLTDPGVHTGHVVRIRAKSTTAGTLKFELLQTTTVIKDSGNQTLTNSYAEYSFTLSSAEAANITDYTALRVRVTSVAAGSNKYHYCSWIQVEIPTVTYAVVTDEGAQAQGSDSPGTIQTHVLGTAEGAQAQASDVPSLVQDHYPLVNEGAQAQAGDVPAIVGVHILTSDEGTQAQAGDVPEITQEVGPIPVVADEGTQAQAADVPAIVQVCVIGTQEGTQAQAGDAPALVQVGVIGADEGAQLQAGDSPAAVQVGVIGTNEGAQAQGADAPVIVQAYVPTAGEGAQAQSGDDPALVQEHNIAAQEGAQPQAGDAPAPVQEHNLATQEGAQAQGADVPVLGIVGGAIEVVPEQGFQTQSFDEATLDRIVALMADEGAQAQMSDEALLGLLVNLAVQEGRQCQRGRVPLIQIETGEVFGFIVDRGPRGFEVVLIERGGSHPAGGRVREFDIGVKGGRE